MKFEIELVRHYPHSVAEVWDGLTRREAISEWLMETGDFVAEAGCAFEMTCLDESGKPDVYRCRVLELEPPDRMVWSWIPAGRDGHEPTEVEFLLTATDTGTTLVLKHRGDREAMLERFESGWPDKLDRLAGILRRESREGSR